MEDLMQYYFETLLLLIQPNHYHHMLKHTVYEYQRHSYCYCGHYCSAAFKYNVSISCVENSLSGSTYLEK